MQLNFITLDKNKQWLKIAVLFLFLALISASFLAFKLHKNFREMTTIYVESDYQGFLSWGSEKHPYDNIPQAFRAASRKKTASPSIYLKNGSYPGNIEIPENMKVYGESREGVTLNNDEALSKILMKNNSLLSDITVIGGNTGILAENSATIENCSVKEFQKIGIDAFLSESEIIVKNSEISNGKGKGLYAQKGRKLQLIENDIHDNKEEGLDLRQSVSGEIIRNKIYGNGESGIESVVGGSRLKISKNEIFKNSSNGITFQYYEVEEKEAEIIVEENKISTEDPEHFAISVANPSGEKNKPQDYWKNSIKIRASNILEGNIKKSLEITN